MLAQQKKHMTDCKNSKKYYVGPVATEFVATNTGIWRIERPDITIEACVFCGTCQKHCPPNVITVEKNEEKKDVHIDWNYCKGCGICANVCPKKCIQMVPEGSVCKL